MREYLHYLTYPYLIRGLWVVAEITVFSTIGALFVGIIVAAMRESRIALIRAPADAYVWVVRGTPILVQLIFIYDVLPRVGWTIPAVPTTIVAFILHEGAYMGELIRGGLHSVNRDQVAAAEALGCRRWTILRRVELPQAVRAMVPPFGNQVINLLKSTSLASTISVNELTLRTTTIVSANFLYFPVFFAAATLYLAMTTFLVLLQRYLERRFNASFEPTPGLLKQLRLRRELSHLRSRLFHADGSSADEDAVSAKPALLDCREVSKYYGQRRVLSRVSLQVAEGEVVALIGPSGSGKSTLLRLVNHLESLDGGSIRVAGEYVGYEATSNGLKTVGDRALARSRANARVAMVFQQFNLFSHLTARENVMFGLVHVYKLERKEAIRKADAALESVGMMPFAEQRPGRLSGGQQQRVAIARALVTDPKLILLDEPTSALDPELVGEVREVLRSLAQQGMTMLCATHDMDFARNVADRVVFLAEGEIVEQGRPEEVLRYPAEERTRQFLRRLAGQFELHQSLDLVPSDVSSS